MMYSRNFWIVVFGFVQLLGCSAALSADKAVAGLSASHKTVSFKSAGKQVSVEWYRPVTESDDAKLPTIIIFHGSGGLGDSGGFFRDLADRLAQGRRAVAVVHYMDSTSLKSAGNAEMARYFGTWLKTAEDTFLYVRQQSFVDKDKISLLGHSLGAQLALQLAAHNRSVASVIDLAGCFVLPTVRITAMPPVLVLHGKADAVVPLTRERSMVSVLKRTGCSYEEHLLPGVDHAFNNISFDEIMGLIGRFLEARKL